MKLKIMLMMITLILFISLAMMGLSLNLAKKKNYSLEKLSPFECGFNPLSKTRISFSLHFFLIALIFVIFDIEIILLIPTSISPYPNQFTLISLSLFLLILTLGLFHEWNQGSINWI